MRHRSKFFVSLFALAALCLGSATAKADSITIVGTSSGLVGATINITSFTPGTEQTPGSLAFTVTNTGAGVITSVGFDLPGALRTGFSGGVADSDPNTAGNQQPGNQLFSFFQNDSQVPQYQGAVIDFGLGSTNNANQTPDFTSGSTNRGILSGTTSGTFTVTGPFFGLTQADLLNNAFVRFQAIPGNPGSDVGRPGGPTPTPTPEPTTMLLLGTGLAGVAAKVRRRRQQQQAV